MEKANPFGKLGITVTMDRPPQEAIPRVKAALKEEGFGVLTEIDVKETLKEKIGVDFHPYTILGACNPRLAHQALSATPAVGLMLPCNVVVEASDGGTLVSAMDPEAGLAAVGEPGLEEVAKEAKERLCRALDSLQTAKG